MNEKPILFSGPMVQAILAGTKTQTRRVVKNKSRSPHGLSCRILSWVEGVVKFGFGNYVSMGVNDWTADVKCPFEVGMKLWVKETHAVTGGACKYRASDDSGWNHWTPSIFMRREHSRINLTVTGIRVERLQDITEADARAEGCRGAHGAFGQTVPGPPLTARQDYQDLWDSINGKKLAWRDNPAVWVVSFKRVIP
jgi:hypothetical protein